MTDDLANELDAIKAKADRGERLTIEERAELMCDAYLTSWKNIKRGMNEERGANGAAVLYSQGQHNAIQRALREILCEVFVISAAHANKRSALEDRVVELEKRDEQTRNYVTCLEGRMKQLENKSGRKRH